jgi:hypothetical protein
MSSPRPATAARHVPRRLGLRNRQWSAPERALVISVMAVLMGALFVTSYSLALGDPVPHGIDVALVGRPVAHQRTVAAVNGVADDRLTFHRFASVGAALHAIDVQNVYAALDLTSRRPTLYVASAAGASVARVLERIAAVDPTVRVVDTHPLQPHDPSGIDLFYLMLVTTIIGFVTVFQVRGNAAGLPLRHWAAWVAGLSLCASLVFTIVDGPLLNRLALPVWEIWGILALQLLAVASFASLASVLLGRWAIVPTWLFLVVLGNSSSGGAVAPPLLPRPFAVISQWLPSGATVTSLRNAVYFHDYQQAQPIVVLAAWATVLFAAMLVVSHRLRTSPGG